ncbi:hypothetical protein A2686_03830 [Candidatus Woesebacteria bacterium RIFCSPHIGHO2_01_FULL_38_10]|uniref:Fibronectin type-III domain-containing protein n=1 Tax=Candidatus Woesebacteria bacterium RIFCSPLOWO2_01_FULL_44_14 TaxID=1802525 RepID=A0A1F8C0V8_9BACT|nr:MAG: hypothetical protein A2686_03830 [Candidatus Woesebacteria bacterium RIFCSPHIGHO2_01_FULL_38_10]OGM69245.1 MAG: hypothetical protein A2975_02315 [Candidatus Woesebacteria bacterium RIFCSPLOWO2_01_FULL_44_14]
MGPMGKKLFISILLFSYFFVPQALSDVYAINAVGCKDKSPASAPVLTSAVAEKDSVTLIWTEAQDPLTYYLVAYGRTETEIEYGSPNVGGRGTTSYVVGKLDQGVKYYFKVRAVNGCKPGKFSNKLSATPGISKGVTKTPNLSIYKSVQGASISATYPVKAEMEIPAPLATIVEESSKCTTCISWQLLIVEAILLILYFYLAEKITFLKPIFSIAIPSAMYILFWEINRECSLKEFACKYFLPLEIMIFMVIVIVYKRISYKERKKK